MENIDVLYDICEVISGELEDANDKIRKAGDKLTAGDVDYIDKLTHTLKSLKTTIAMVESEGGSYDDGMGGGMSYENRGGGRGGRGSSYAEGGSYARGGRGGGRGRNARRDSMGRYSRAGGYSRAEGVKEMLRDAMNEAETEREREAIRKALMEMDR